MLFMLLSMHRHAMHDTSICIFETSVSEIYRESKVLNKALLPERLVVWQLERVPTDWKIPCEFREQGA